MTRLLLVEDDPQLRGLLAGNLAHEGFEVTAVADGETALGVHGASPFAFLVLDLMLPGTDGFQVLQALRGRGDGVPVLLLTARGAMEDRLKGLGLGADDYVVKPFSVVELLGRIRAILRRTAGVQGGLLTSGGLTLNRTRRQAYVEGRSLSLTEMEFLLLDALWAHAGVPLGREELIALLWGPGEPTGQKKLNVHIAHLRRKLEEAGPGEWIRTVGPAGRSGYQWALPVKTE
jgi:DNA-binding response OmpR family regulator